jgi:hypothetical protein
MPLACECNAAAETFINLRLAGALIRAILLIRFVCLEVPSASLALYWIAVDDAFSVMLTPTRAELLFVRRTECPSATDARLIKQPPWTAVGGQALFALDSRPRPTAWIAHADSALEAEARLVAAKMQTLRRNAGAAARAILSRLVPERRRHTAPADGTRFDLLVAATSGVAGHARSLQDARFFSKSSARVFHVLGTGKPAQQIGYAPRNLPVWGQAVCYIIRPDGVSPTHRGCDIFPTIPAADDAPPRGAP